jgi:thymidylate synthase (FAD)
MSVELIWATQNAEQLITKMARVSNPDNEDNMETAPRLLRYLINHKHWSPFEMANMCVKINTERDISAQILRHRSFTFQEYSSRYAQMPPAALPDFRRQDLKNRQNSIDDLDDVILDEINDKVAVQMG